MSKRFSTNMPVNISNIPGIKLHCLQPRPNQSSPATHLLCITFSFELFPSGGLSQPITSPSFILPTSSHLTSSFTTSTNLLPFLHQGLLPLSYNLNITSVCIFTPCLSSLALSPEYPNAPSLRCVS